MGPSLVRAALWCSVVVSGVSAQSTTVVSGGGGALNRAVQQATPGDRLIVRAGRYDALQIDRGLQIDCDPGVRFAALSPQGGASRIAGVPTGQWLVLRGGGIESGIFSQVEIDSCAGLVTWVGPTFESVTPTGFVRIDQCSSVSIEAPRFVAGWGNGWRILVDGSSVHVSDAASCAALFAGSSNLTLDDVVVVKTYNVASLGARSSVVTVSGGSFPGSNQNLALISLPGIALSMSELTITGWATVTSGDGQIGLQGAIEGDGNSFVRLDPSVALTAPGTPIQGGVSVGNETVAFLVLPGLLRSGVPFDMATHGASQDVVFVFLDLPVAPPVRTAFGPLWVRPTAPLFDVVTIPAGSTSALTRYVVPSLPAALPLVLQPIRLGSTGSIGLGTASRVTVN